jgi:RimJ/RimL family protein N-acetyltransferase
MIVTRRIRPYEGAMLGATRLAALVDTPSAFARTHEEEVQYGADEWDRRADGWSQGAIGATFFAEDEGGVVGLVGCHRRSANAVELVSMWVAPTARGLGGGRALVDAVLDWAGDDPVELWVTRGNEPAQRLYERCGFVTTGEVQPLPSDPCKDEVRMQLKRPLRG